MVSSIKQLPKYSKIGILFFLVSFAIFLIQTISVFIIPLIKIPMASSDSLILMFSFYINIIILIVLSLFVYYRTETHPTQVVSPTEKVLPKETPKISKKAKGNIELYIKLGDKYKLDRKYPQALEMYNRALEIDENNVNTLNSLGVIYRNTGEYSKALDVVQKARLIDPKNKFAWNLLGLIYSNTGDYKKAIDAYIHARDLDSLQKEPWQNLAIAYYKNGDYEEAIDHMKIGLDEDPKYSMMWYKLAKMYLVAGRIEDAIKTCNTCLKLDTANESAKQLLNKLKKIQEGDYTPEPEIKPETNNETLKYTEIGYEKFLTEAIEEYKNLGRIPARGDNPTIAFRKWYNKTYRREL